jgi:hypothetical protein
LVRLRADGHDPAIVVGTTPMNTNFLMGRRDITGVAELAGGRGRLPVVRWSDSRNGTRGAWSEWHRRCG